MSEPLRETTGSGEKRSFSILSVGIVVLMVYLLFPHLFLLPLLAIYGNSSPPPAIERAAMIYLAPAFTLYDTVPAYRIWLDVEMGIMNRMFPDEEK